MTTEVTMTTPNPDTPPNPDELSIEDMDAVAGGGLFDVVSQVASKVAKVENRVLNAASNITGTVIKEVKNVIQPPPPPPPPPPPNPHQRPLPRR
jgi:hypothetical protein